MDVSMTRRDFLGASVAAAGLLAAGQLQAAPFKTRLYKAMTLGEPTQDLLKALKDAGFDGMETDAWKARPDEAAKARERAEALGMKLHSVLFGWANFNQENQVAKDLENVRQALRRPKPTGLPRFSWCRALSA